MPLRTAHLCLPAGCTRVQNDGIVAMWKLSRGTDSKVCWHGDDSAIVSDSLIGNCPVILFFVSCFTQDAILGVHKGPVHAITFDADFGPRGLLFSGSADRTIKVWDPWVRELKDSCIQTVVGHGGTINALACGTDCLVSCSNDCTIKVWRPDRDRRILLYPWFLLTQTITLSACVWLRILTRTALVATPMKLVMLHASLSFSQMGDCVLSAHWRKRCAVCRRRRRWVVRVHTEGFLDDDSQNGGT